MTVFKKLNSRGGVSQEETGFVPQMSGRSGTALVDGQVRCQPSAHTDSSTKAPRRLGVKWGGGR